MTAPQREPRGKKRRKKAALATDAAETPSPRTAPTPTEFPATSPWYDRLFTTLTAPQPIVRLEALRILLPLAILGFMSERLLHTGEWLTDLGFQVPDLGGSWKQPLYIPPVPLWLAWIIAASTVVSGLMTALGAKTRLAAGLFASCLFYFALNDRLSAFTVSKLGPLLVLGLCLTAAGTRYSVDSWLRRRKDPRGPLPTHVTWGQVRYFQAMLVVLYCASGIAKMNGDWLDHPAVLWTHVHDSYQTGFSHWFSNLMPAWGWGPMQYATLGYEALAPLLFAWATTRPWAVAYGLAMHLLIGLMFGPVVWFALLMMSLIAGGFLPVPWLERALARLEPRAPPPPPQPRGS